MGILRATGKKNIGILKLRVVAEKLQKSLGAVGGSSRREFGFGHEGALSIPCQWREVEKLLASDN